MTVCATLALQLRPDAVEAAHDVLRAALVDTRGFDGCLGVDVLVDEADPIRVLLLESGESFSHDDAYRAWRATPEGASGLGAVVAAPPVLTRYTVADDV